MEALWQKGLQSLRICLEINIFILLVCFLLLPILRFCKRKCTREGGRLGLPAGLKSLSYLEALETWGQGGSFTG